ncbi:MAG: tetratricopeptide repeat protein [Spirochaetales bacterium]|nr:tetratricopeptide repeat protein [Spirochaetales bacterium]
MRRSFFIFALLWAHGLFANAYQDGKRAFSRRDYKTAHTLFQQALKENPGNGDPLFYIGYMHENQGRKGEAMQAYGRAVGLAMTADLKEKAFWRLVLHYRYQNDWENLYIYASRFQRFKPNSRVAAMLSQAEASRDPARGRFEEHVRSAEEYSRQKKHALAAREYANALTLRPAFHQVRWKLALELMELRDYTQAARELQQLISSGERWEYHYKHAVCLYHLGAYQKALDSFQKSDALQEEKGKKWLSTVSLGRGLAYLELGNLDEARLALEKSLQAGESSRARIAMVRYHILAEELAAAEIQALRLQQAGENHPDLHMALGLSALKAGKLDRARSELQKMEEIYRGEKSVLRNDTALHALAKLSCKAGAREDCARLLGEVDAKLVQVELTQHSSLPYNSKSALNEQNYYHALLYLEAGQTDRALSSLALIKTDLRAYFERARIHARRGDVRETRELIAFLTSKNADYWEHARRDVDISGLAGRNPEFAVFLRNDEIAPP